MISHPDLYILRHGETVWNQEGRFQGWQDSPLTDKGQDQARQQRVILEQLDNMPGTAFVSPLGRTRETAALALPAHCKITIDDRLQEIHFGQWEGKTREEIEQLTDMSMDTGLWHFHSPGGEAERDITARVQAFLTSLDGPAIVVTHGITSAILRGLCMGLDAAAAIALPKDQGCVFHVRNGQETILRAA